MTGTSIGPLNPLDPDTDMRGRGFQPSVWGFTKAEGMVGAAGSRGVGGGSITMNESGAGADPGRVWRFTQLGGALSAARCWSKAISPNSAAPTTCATTMPATS
jgi:hypothetical protein